MVTQIYLTYKLHEEGEISSDVMFEVSILLRFYPFKSVKNMSSLIESKINLCLVSNQFFIVSIILCATLNDLTEATTICFNYFSSLTPFRVHNNNCSLDLYDKDLQTTIILFTRNVSSHKIN